MSTAQLLEQFERLSPLRQKEAEDFIRFLAASEHNDKSALPPLTFSWAGGLADLRGQFTSHALKKKALDWMSHRGND